MKREYVLGLAVLVLCACGQRGAPDEPKDQPSARAAEQATVADEKVVPYIRKPGRLAGPMPGGIELDFPFHVRSDVAIVPPGGAGFRRTVIVLRGMEEDEAIAMLTRSLNEAGFEAQPDQGPKNQRYRQVFSKPGFGEVTMEIKAYSEQADSGSQNAFRVTLDFPPKAAGADS